MSAALVLGLINGLSIALLALGLVLVFKAGRYVNVAHAQLGVTSAMLLGKLVLDHGWSWWLAFPLVVALGAGVGALVEVLVIRRLAGRSPTSILVATIGVAQLLLALTFFDGLRADPQRLVLEGYPVPFDTRIEIGALVLRGQHMMILIVGPLLAAGLAIVLRTTTLGKTIRAAASNPAAASLAGISVRRVSTIAWACAGVLSAITAVLQAPGQTAVDLQALGPGLLLRALGAAVIAGMTNLPVTFAAGVGLGVTEAVVLHQTKQGGAAEAVMFAVVLAALFVRGRFVRLAVAAQDQPAMDDRPVHIPAAIARRPIVRFQRTLLIGFSLFLGVIAPSLPVFRSDSDRFLLAVTLIYALVAVSLTFLAGWAGQMSIGQFALVGLGAFLAARLTPAGWSLGATAVIAGCAGAAVAAAVGLPALRLRGLTLAVTTLGLAVVAPAWLYRQDWLGAAGSVAVGPPRQALFGSLASQRATYYVVLVVLVLTVLAAGNLRRSRFGRLVIAVRDNEQAAAAFGISPTRIRVTAVALSGFVAAVAGVLWLSAWRTVSPSSFPAEQSLLVLAMPIIGGLGSLAGAVLGAVLVFGIPAFTGDWVRSVFPNTVQFALALSGIGLIVTQIQYPGGIASSLRQVWERILAAVAREVNEGGSSAPASLETPTQVSASTFRPAVRAETTAADVLHPVLEVHGAAVSFGGIQALNDVSLHVMSDEIVGLIGTNGAGKTTLLNVVSGMIRAEAGSISLLGHEITGVRVQQRAALGIARSFQDARLFPGLTVREALQVALSPRYRSGLASEAIGAPWARLTEKMAKARADELIERFGLAAWAEVRTAELSTGTRRICDLAAQLATEPRLLLLDEPTAGVAQREAEAFGPLLRRIRSELGCAILIVEHDMPLMLGLADRIYCLESGGVIATGTPAEVRADSRVIASYLGTDAAAIDRSGPTVGVAR